MILHEIITAEKVPITYRVAGLGSRFLAWLVDMGLIVLFLVLCLMAGSVLDVARRGLGLAVFGVASFCVQWGYFLLFEWLWHGQTPGKRLMGLRVIDWGGSAVSFPQAAARNLLRVADGLPLLLVDVLPPLVYGLGFVVAACNRENRRLGDLAAGTLVVHMDRRARAVQALPDAPTTDPARHAQARQRLAGLDRRQKQTLLDLCLRRDQLPMRDRARLFQETAEYVQARLGLPRDEWQSDEKFVLQVAALLGERSS